MESTSDVRVKLSSILEDIRSKIVEGTQNIQQMESTSDVRVKLSNILEDIRSKIVEGTLVLFVGEQLSALDSPENPCPSLDDWWEIIKHPEKGVEELFDLEDKFLKNTQQTPSRIHNALRNVGKFPLIITTNMDDLLERFLWKTGNISERVGEKVRLDQISCVANCWPKLRRDLIIKCLGDTGFNAQILPISKKYFEDFCSTLKSTEVEFMRQIFNERSVLFLGCDSDRPEYKNLFRKFAVDAKVKHYNFKTSEKSDLEENGNFLTLKANLRHWEFVQLLSTGTIQEDIQPGQVYLRSYLRIQRDQYLQQQLALEKKASEIILHTTTVTNALSPDEYFELISRRAIEDMFMKDSFGIYSEEKVQRTLDAMKGRRDNLKQVITNPESKTRVICLFHYHGVKREIQMWKEVENSPPPPEQEKQQTLLKCKISISKYAKVILLANSFMNRSSSLEIRIVGDSTKYDAKEVGRETFALIRLKGGTDEAICYADQASSAEERNFATHLININGEEVSNKRKVYERSRLIAWSNEDSILKLATAIMKENDEMRKRYGIKAIDNKDLTALEQLTRISHKFRSELDAGYFERIGEGNFGYVFQAQKGGRTVAVKILKNKEDSKQIENFEREVDMLRKASHQKIVEVLSIHISKQNELSIVMEFMAGGNLKEFLKKTEGQGQGKDFTERFIEDIGSAIEHLHSLNVMHRDVKPENIFLSKDHEILKLGDFGLARATEGTRHTKTLTGSYRYMAPEVVTSGGHYSMKADVHSFGLCLIEVLSGKTVFSDIENHKRVFDIKMSGEKPSIPLISSEVFGEELAVNIRTIVDECMKPETSRPKMKAVLSILQRKEASIKNKVELYCMASDSEETGLVQIKPGLPKATIFYSGMVLLRVNTENGVIKLSNDKSAPKEFPKNVPILHNENKSYPEANEPYPTWSFSGSVDDKVKTYVLKGAPEDQDCNWKVSSEMEQSFLGEFELDGAPKFLDEDKLFFIKVHRVLHSEVIDGFVLFFKTKPILGYSLYSKCNEDLYEFVFQASTVVIVNARENEFEKQAGLAIEIENYLKKGQLKDTKVYLAGPVADTDQTDYLDESHPCMQQLREHEYITLWEEGID